MITVALFTSAWIETTKDLKSVDKEKSRSSRARGLKHFVASANAQASVSRSSRARGLKQAIAPQAHTRLSVALFTSAWIETLNVFAKKPAPEGRALHERVD